MDDNTITLDTPLIGDWFTLLLIEILLLFVGFCIGFTLVILMGLVWL